MTRRILVPLDGSATAETVLPQAIAMARAGGDELLLLRLVTPNEASQSPFWKATMPAYLRSEWEEAALGRADVELRAVAERVRAAGLRATSEVRGADDAAEGIIARADEDGTIGLVAMATHGRSGPGRWVFGSVAAKVLQAVATPLLLVRVRGDSPAAMPVSYRELLVPLDGSEFAEQALAHARLVAGSTGAALTLLSVVGSAEDDAEAEIERATAAAYLERAAGPLRRDGLTVRTLVAAGAPAERILERAAEGRADLIVMATHGRSGWRRLWLGSVANKVVERAETPVLLVRPEVKEER
jgi:nucleotide-binding universal stress UspA family protein